MTDSANNYGFTQPSNDDQRGWLWVVTILSIIYSLAFLGARVFVKYGHLGKDDIVIGFAYAVASARWGAIMKGFTLGLGAIFRETTSRHAAGPALAKLAFWSRTSLLTCHWFAKGSIAVFTRRLFSGDMNHERLIFSVAFALLIATGLTAILLSSISCSAESIVRGTHGPECQAGDVRWIAICALDVISEIVLFALPAFLLVPLQTSWNKKRKVLLYYSFRGGVVALSIAQTTAFTVFLYRGRPSIGLSRALILQELLLCYSLVSATIPCMRTFVGAFAGPSLGLAAHTMATGIEAYQLHSMSTKFAGTRDHEDREQLRLTPGAPMYNVSVEHREHSRSLEQVSIGSDGSEQMIIRRDMQIRVERED